MATNWPLKSSPKAYLDRYPDGPKADLAREILRQEGKLEEPPIEVADENVTIITGDGEEIPMADVGGIVEGKDPKHTALREEAGEAVRLAEETIVDDDDSYSQVGHKIGGVKALIKKIEDYHADNIKRWYDGHKAALAERNKDTDPLRKAITVYEQKLRDHRKKLQAAEEERQRQAAEALAKQQEEEAAAMKSDKEAEIVPWTEEVESQQVAQVAAIMTPPIEAPKVEGMHTRDNWKWEVDPNAPAINGVPATVPREFLTLDTKKINATVKALKGDAAAHIPGILVSNEESFVHR